MNSWFFWFALPKRKPEKPGGTQKNASYQQYGFQARRHSGVECSDFFVRGRRSCLRAEGQQNETMSAEAWRDGALVILDVSARVMVATSLRELRELLDIA